MSYKNFVPTVWAEGINRELEKALVFAPNTNQKYEGSVTQRGDTVKILGVGKVTVTTQKGSGPIILTDPEEIEDTSVSMIIDTVSDFNYRIDDIDKRNAVDGLVDALNKEATYGLADEIDKSIAELAKEKVANKVYSSVKSITAATVLDELDYVKQLLAENNVRDNMEVSVTAPPWFVTLVRKAYRELDTNNSDLIKNGAVGMYNGMVLKQSNNCAKDSSGNSLIQIKTNNAIAHARPLTHTEPYRPERRFSDAVKGFVLYGSKIVRPKEMFVLNCKKGE